MTVTSVVSATVVQAYFQVRLLKSSISPFATSGENTRAKFSLGRETLHQGNKKSDPRAATELEHAYFFLYLFLYFCLISLDFS
ncbi:unnamed protein product [Fructobacillus cardui]|nr:unnamed protein product [Fructobacillus cardui]